MRRRRWAARGVGCLTFVLFLGLAGTNAAVLDRMTALVFDAYQRLQPREQAGAPVAIVDIDEVSLRALGQWPWPRRRLAELVDRLGEMGAAAIAFDVIFAEPDRTSVANALATLEAAGAEVRLPDGGAPAPDSDDALAAAFARHPVVAGLVLTGGPSDRPPKPKAGFAFGGADPRTYLADHPGSISNLPALDAAAAGLGFFSLPLGQDGVVRRVPLVARSRDVLLPALGVEALRVAQGAGSLLIRSTGASGEMATASPAMTALKVGGFEVPTTADGDLWVYYSGMPALTVVSAASLLGADGATAALRPLIEGRIVLIGTSAAGLRDLFVTPLGTGVPGVHIHTEAIDQIMSGTYLARPDWAFGAEIATAAALVAILLSVLPRVGPTVGMALCLAMIAVALVVSWRAFVDHHLLLDPLLPSLSVFGVYASATGAILLLIERERRFIRDAFSHYLAPDLVDRLADHPGTLKLGGETREITILFCDIRGFSSLSESLTPEDVTRLLNNFLTPMTDVLMRSGATIDKYIGDSIMAFWNAPLPVADHARRACLAALDMCGALAELNRREGSDLRIGVGLNTGQCCVGNLGSEQRFSYSAIGDAVNVASRAEGLTKQYGLPILVSASTAAGAADLALLEIDRVRVLGRARPVGIFALLGDAALAATEDFRALRDVQQRLLAAYCDGRFAEAEAALRQARRLAPPTLAPLHDLYAARLTRFGERQPPPDWDGVHEAVRK